MSTVINGSTGISTKKVAAEEMGTVGGDDVVASGSNNDGSWTKLADGTMTVRNYGVELSHSNMTQAFAAGVNLPAAFLVGEYVPFATMSALSQGYGDASDRDAIASTRFGGVSASSTFEVVCMKPGNVAFAGTFVQVHIYAEGRWK